MNSDVFVVVTFVRCLSLDVVCLEHGHIVWKQCTSRTLHCNCVHLIVVNVRQLISSPTRLSHLPSRHSTWDCFTSESDPRLRWYIKTLNLNYLCISLTIILIWSMWCPIFLPWSTYNQGQSPSHGDRFSLRP